MVPACLRSRRHLVLIAVLLALAALLLAPGRSRAAVVGYMHSSFNKHEADKGGAQESKTPPRPQYLPEPTWTPPPVKDPFPALGTAEPPPVPAWNRPRENLHRQYGIDYAPPLLIGFTRSWPMLLQTVVSYITAGWPPEQILVVENTGVMGANADGRLTLQNPFFLDHARLRKLGVGVAQTPVRLTFAQLQNFYTHLAQVNSWPYYFWSHMDVLAFSFEDGSGDNTPRAGEDGYQSVYERCLAELRHAVDSNQRWAVRFFAYDHLTLVNRDAYKDVGGWDTFIPYYMTDCDMHSRLQMRNWTLEDSQAGVIVDVSAVLDDLRALYRDPSVEPAFTDPNPPPPEPEPTEGPGKRAEGEPAKEAPPTAGGDALEYYRKLRKVADTMYHYKHGSRGRNTWQLGQHGGQGEPFYYPSRGIAEATDLMIETGREVFRRKWGHRDCDLIDGTRLKYDDQWRVAKDWE